MSYALRKSNTFFLIVTMPYHVFLQEFRHSNSLKKSNS